jgi:hypothetical protein
MLYTSLQLKDPEIKTVAISRYLHKYTNQQRDFKRLKLHEKEFLFNSMRSLITINEKGENEDLAGMDTYTAWKYLESKGMAEKAFDLYEMEQAYEFIFYRIVLDYHDNLYFLSPVKGPYGLLTRDEIQKDKGFFEMYFPIWEQLLFSNKGNYIPHISKEYRDKIKILEQGCKERKFGYNQYLNKEKELKLTCFHIYYRTRYFFEEHGDIIYKIEIDGKLFIVDVYSYIHILSRHYMPNSNNFDLAVSFNEEVPFIDIYQLPISIESLLKEYYKLRKLEESDEYFILRYDTSYYIFWIRFVYLDSIKDDCFHFRTFYKIKKKKDFEKLVGLSEINIHDKLFFYI